MDNEIFRIKSETDLDFLCNKNTGAWVLGEDINSEVLGITSKTPSCNKFQGTSMVVLNITRVCNLDCIYCFAADVKGVGKMDNIIGRKAIDRILELPRQSRKVIFHGNEPMTNFALIKDLVPYSNGQIDFCIQSNGTLFTNEQINYLVNNRVGIGISLDGLAKHQNSCRPYIGGAGSFDDVMSNIHKVIDAQGNVSLITVVSKHNVDDLEEIADSFQKEGIKVVCFNPAYPDGKNDFCPDQKVLAQNMIKIFDKEIERKISGKQGISTTNLKDLLRTFFSPKFTYNCARCSGTSLHPLIGIDVDGSIYPCDMFWGREQYKVGHINEMSLTESFNSQRNFRVYRTLDGIEQCSKCDWKMFCGAECPGVSVRCDSSIASKGFYCDYRKAVLGYVASKIPLLHQKRVLGEMLA